MANDNEMSEIRQLMRVGIVSSINDLQRTARVKIEELGIVTSDLKIVDNMPTYEGDLKVDIKPWMPKVGTWVLCIFKPGGDGDGFILGGI